MWEDFLPILWTLWIIVLYIILLVSKYSFGRKTVSGNVKYTETLNISGDFNCSNGLSYKLATYCTHFKRELACSGLFAYIYTPGRPNAGE